ncbi:MAG: cytochrome P450, partial [Acidimicrobiia bacterium]|nr:cytochrome P450 [Acidimicrobiia bacterium]
EGIGIPETRPEVAEYFNSMIAMDDPRHARLRRIVARGFTPRKLDSLKADVEEIAAGIVAEAAGRGSCDFVRDVAALVPLRVIVDLMGIPRSYEQFIFDRTNIALGASDAEYVADQTARGRGMAVQQAGEELVDLVRDLAEARAREPRNDLITELVTADVDGEQLTPTEIGSFFILLVAAGNETTRNAIAHGLHMLSEHPDQRAAWQEDFDRLAPSAVEEIIRYASPVIHFRRTVTRDDVALGDHVFSAGDKVVLWYGSANRDEAVFGEPDRFDITRTPNDHVGFGGPGPHFCLGAHLARREVTVTFRELFRQVPDIVAVGEPDRLRSNFINGIKHLQAEFTAV